MKLNKWSKYLLILSSLVLSISPIPFIVSCSNNSLQAYTTVNNINNNLPNVEKDQDYLEKINEIDNIYKQRLNEYIMTQNEANKQKSNIKQVMDIYRLKEWNDYYNTNHRPNDNNIYHKEHSEVLNLKFINYNKKPKKDDINSTYKKMINEINCTNVYQKQDKQFQYFNNFINFSACEQNDQLNDFFYLRWKFFAYYADDVYNHIRVKVALTNKPIWKIEFSDWINAIVRFIIPEPFGGSQEPLKEMLTEFALFYGMLPLTTKPGLNSHNPNGFISAHALLVAKDMIMRYSSIPEYEFIHNPLIYKKALIAKHAYIKTKENFDSFLNTLNPTNSNGPITSDKIEWPQIDDKDKQLSEEEKQDYLNKALGFVNILFDILKKAITNLVNSTIQIKLSDYCKQTK